MYTGVLGGHRHFGHRIRFQLSKTAFVVSVLGCCLQYMRQQGYRPLTKNEGHCPLFLFLFWTKVGFQKAYRNGLLEISGYSFRWFVEQTCRKLCFSGWVFNICGFPKPTFEKCPLFEEKNLHSKQPLIFTSGLYK